MRGILALAVVGLGCAQDPCEGITGTCLLLEVRWRDSGPDVDQIEIEGTRGLTLPPGQSRTPPTAGPPFPLPALVPIGAGPLSGTFALRVRGLRGDVPLGEATLDSLVAFAGEHRRFTVELIAPAGLDGSIDLAVDDSAAAADLELPCVVPDPAELWVDDDDPAGDGGLGSQGCPLPTLTQALALARTAGSSQKRIHLLPGTYNRESFPLYVRNGISIEGVDAGVTVVQGSGTWVNAQRHAFNYSNDGGTERAVAIVVGSAANEVNSLSGFTLRPPPEVFEPSLIYTGILCDRGNAPATLGTAAPAPNVVLDDMTVGPHYFYGVVATNDFGAGEGCNLRVTNSRFIGGMGGLLAVGCTAETGGLRAPVAVEIGTPAGRGNQLDNVGLSFNDAFNLCGIDILDCASPVAIHHNRFRNSGCGVRVSVGATASSVVIDDNDMADLRYHGIALLEHTRATLRRNVITNVDASVAGAMCFANPALCMSVASEVVARGNRFIGNQTGVALRGSGLGGERNLIDFGTASEPGGNVFSCNSRAPATPTYDVYADFNTASTGNPVTMVGNSWDHFTPSVSGSNGTDLYITGMMPPTFVTSPEASPQPMGSCPAGRTP